MTLGSSKKITIPNLEKAPPLSASAGLINKRFREFREKAP